jgi:threonine 3-dehydrogenase
MPMSVLVTGGTGFIGSHLARRLVKEGYDPVLLDIAPNYKPINDIKDQVRVVPGDLAVLSDVLDAAKEHQVRDIFHLGAILSAAAESAPMTTIGVNFLGTVNVLEAARILGIEKVVYSSSVASYGPGLPEPVREDARQEPRTIYGISKVFSELMGLYYWRRYGIDFRAVRFPSVVGPGRGAGGASAYTTLIIQNAALKQPYDIDVDEDARMPILYCKDAVNALLTLYNSKNPRSRIYNIAGVSPNALEILEEVRRHIPDAQTKFAPKPEIVAIVDSWPAVLDDDRARRELGWKLAYPLDRLVPDFISELRAHKHLYA